MAFDIGIVIPVDTAHTAFVRSVIAESAHLESSLDEDRVQDLLLLATEAVTNAIGAHQNTNSCSPVRVSCSIGRDCVTIVVRDEGVGFNPETLPEMPSPESEERLQRESGMGVTLMRMLADEVDIISGPDGTTVRLTLCINREGKRDE